jgi:hypothetical protein
MLSEIKIMLGNRAAFPAIFKKLELASHLHYTNYGLDCRTAHEGEGK